MEDDYTVADSILIYFIYFDTFCPIPLPAPMAPWPILSIGPDICVPCQPISLQRSLPVADACPVLPVDSSSCRNRFEISQGAYLAGILR